MSAASRIRVGIVGAGRSRNGLGPFLASHVEAAGGEVVAVSGRDVARAAVAAADLQTRLDHPVAAARDLEDLLARDLDALIIAAPAEAHLSALRATLGAGVPVLCEKPLLTEDDRAEIPALVGCFRAADLLLMENCQWPLVLPAFGALFEGLAPVPTSNFAMRLSPAHSGPAMLVDSLSHPLSVLQEMLDVTAETRLSDIRFTGDCSREAGLVTEFTLEAPFPAVACRLELMFCESQPRPAWLSIDGRRMDREIVMPGYRFAFSAAGRSVMIDDPSAALVYRFAEAVRDSKRERNGTESVRVEQRARLFDVVLDAHLSAG